MAEDKKGGIGSISGIYWRYLAVFSVVSALLYSWNSFFSTGAPAQYTVNYSQFIEQLNAGNIKSVSIKALHVSGEFVKEVNIQFQGAKKPANVKYFQTFLPSFQGEGLLSQLREKNVIINIESAEQGYLWQIMIGVLPWALIIGFWVLMMRRNQKIQGGPGGLFTFGASKAKLYETKKPSITFKDVAGMDNVKDGTEGNDRVPEGPLQIRKDRGKSSQGGASDRARREPARPFLARNSRGGSGAFLQHQRF